MRSFGLSQEISFRHAAPSRLLWAFWPAMRVVQALHRMQDALARDGERQRMRIAPRYPRHGKAILVDLEADFSALPIWTQTDRLNLCRAAAATS